MIGGKKAYIVTVKRDQNIREILIIGFPQTDFALSGSHGKIFGRYATMRTFFCFIGY